MSKRHPAPAPVVDPVLARALKDEPDPVESIALDQAPAYAYRMLIPGTDGATHQRLALLDCGHFALTRSTCRAGCPRCGAMIRAGYDYDGFRRLGEPDHFRWPDDPLRELHER